MLEYVGRFCVGGRLAVAGLAQARSAGNRYASIAKEPHLSSRALPRYLRIATAHHQQFRLYTPNYTASTFFRFSVAGNFGKYAQQSNPSCQCPIVVTPRTLSPSSSFTPCGGLQMLASIITTSGLVGMCVFTCLHPFFCSMKCRFLACLVNPNSTT